MFGIIGATGQVGTATALALRQAGVPVRAITRSEDKASKLQQAGCDVAVAELQNSSALAQALSNVEAVHVIVPLSPQASDPVADMRESMDSIIEALRQARPKRILLISDYGAHVNADIGMPSMFHEMEKRFCRLEGHKIILRSAEHMHNWARGLAPALESGTLASFQDPIDLIMPTIAAQDLGQISASLLLAADDAADLTIVHAEGPLRYSAKDVAEAISQLSGRTIVAQAVPRAKWEQSFAKMPSTLADLLIKAGDAKNNGLVDIESNVGTVRRGQTRLVEALGPFVSQTRGG